MAREIRTEDELPRGPLLAWKFNFLRDVRAYAVIISTFINQQNSNFNTLSASSTAQLIKLDDLRKLHQWNRTTHFLLVKGNSLSL